MNIVGQLIYSKDIYADQCGWFKVVEHIGGNQVRGKRVMRTDGRIVKNSKLRIKFDLTKVVVVSQAKLEQDRDDAYKAADARYQHLMDELHK